MPDLPVVCSLTPEALSARRQGLLKGLMHKAQAVTPLPDGYRIRFEASAEALAVIARAVEAERHCCRFLRFGVVVEPDEGPMSLDLTGPPGTREFLAALAEM